MKIFVTAQTIVGNEAFRHQLSACCPNVPLYFCKLAKNFTREDFIREVFDAEVIVLGRELIGAEELARLPHLKIIIKYGVGLDNINLEKCEKNNITVLKQEGINSDSVAEYTVGLILAGAYRYLQGHQNIMADQWKKQVGSLIKDKVVSIIGVGAVGGKVARILRSGFGCKVLLNDIIDKTIFANEIGAEICSLEQAVAAGDVISLHVPLTQETQSMINGVRLAKMKTEVIVINTSRGPVIDNAALGEFLNKNPRAYAALDVFSEEPLQYAKSPFTPLRNILLTPHSAGSAKEVILHMIDDIAAKINRVTMQSF